jgi:hypothetical protein
MSKTNHQILEENRAEILKFADAIKDPGVTTGQAVVEFSQAIKLKTTNVQDLVANGDFTTAIQELDEIKDNKIGIVWHKSADLGNGTKALIRDARGVTTDLTVLKKEANEKYAMQLLNEVRGGLDLIDKSALDKEVKELAKEKFMHIAQSGMLDIDKLNDKTIRVFNTQMVNTLEIAGIEDASGQLNFAKEISNFKDEHRHIVTLTVAEDKNGQRHTVAEAEIMLNGLTETQKQQYTDIGKSQEGKKSGVLWFDNMPKYKQDLLRDSAADIASGKKIIPTQLLGDAVGIRNAYQKVTTIKGSEDKVSKVLSQTLHCGAPATKIKVVDKAQRQDIATENVKQLQSFTAPEAKLNLNILNSKTPFNVRGENFIFDQLKKAKKETQNVTSTASPINRWRLLGGGRDTNKFKETLADIAGGLEDNGETKNVTSYLKKGGSRFGNFVEAITFGAYKSTETKAKAEIAKLAESNSDLAKDLGVAMECRNLADSTTLGSSSENVSLELTAKMNMVANSAKLKGGALNKALPQESINKIPDNVDFCKSGKDRTGYVQAKNTQLSVASHLGIDPKSKLGQKNLVFQVAGNHTQEMAGIQGGTVGCHSVKTNPEFALNKQDKAMNGVINQKSSSFNSSVKVVENKGVKKEIVTKFIISFASAQSKKEKPVVRSQSIFVEPSKSKQLLQNQVKDLGSKLVDQKTRSLSAPLLPKPKGKDAGIGGR